MLHQHFDAVPFSPITDPLQTFLCSNQKPLTRAAHLIAGSADVACINQLVDATARPGPLDATACRQVKRLLGILSLEHVHDDNRPEASFFAAINPADPFVETICMLTGGLRSAIEDSQRLGAAPEHGR